MCAQTPEVLEATFDFGGRTITQLRYLQLWAGHDPAHSADMVRHRYFSHDSLSGAGPADRARRTGYIHGGCSWTVGEVLAWGTARSSTAAAIVRAWLRSPGHRDIILSSRYADAGVGTRAGTPAGHDSGVTVTVVVGRRSC